MAATQPCVLKRAIEMIPFHSGVPRVVGRLRRQDSSLPQWRRRRQITRVMRVSKVFEDEIAEHPSDYKVSARRISSWRKN